MQGHFLTKVDKKQKVLKKVFDFFNRFRNAQHEFSAAKIEVNIRGHSHILTKMNKIAKNIRKGCDM